MGSLVLTSSTPFKLTTLYKSSMCTLKLSEKTLVTSIHTFTHSIQVFTPVVMYFYKIAQVICWFIYFTVQELNYCYELSKCFIIFQ